MLRLAGLLLFVALPAGAHARAAEVFVDCAKPAGTFRALHGVNGGPLDRGGLVDLSAFHRKLAVPLTRLHDCHWPNPDVVDVHVVFPDSRADPARPESYDFARTDGYVDAVISNGSGIVYRLGESIEHGPDKRRLQPPRDPAQWAAVCLGIVRHYNDGWAGGFRHDIRYWEIWNEPDNRPNMWAGSDEDYFRLYAAAAKAIRKEFPALRVGGPAVGNVGRLERDGRGAVALRPSPFVEKFLAFCKRESLPMDFFSWHLYCDDPAAVAAYAKAVRRVLDARGFPKAESHLNEWNYLPDNDWAPLTLAGQGEARRRFCERVGGSEGAAFAAATLIALQDCPLDAANYFAADTGELGLFDRYGEPRKTFYSLKAFRALLDTPLRVRATTDAPAVAAAAGTDPGRGTVKVLVSNRGAREGRLTVTIRGLPWPGPSQYQVHAVDDGHDLTPAASGTLAAGGGPIEPRIGPPAVLLVTLRPAAAP
jgi:hypothetical protein